MTHHILVISSFLQKPIADATYAVVRFFEESIQRYKERQMYKKTVKELSKMSDKDLYDIGINRYDIPFIARGDFNR